MPLPIMWAPILQKGAEALAEGLGRRLGEELGGAAGKALAKIIFGDDGSNSAQWQAEVDLRLSRIEQKLDGVIDFIRNQLPALVYSQVTDAILAQRVNDIKGGRLGVALALVAYEADKSTSNKEALRRATDNVAQLGYSLAQNGPAWYAATHMAFVSSVSGYSRLLADDASLAPVLVQFARQMQDITTVWLEPQTSRSIAEVLNTKQSEYASAQHIVGQQPMGNFLLAVHLGPISFGQTSYMGPSDPNLGRMHTYWGTKAWIERKGAMWGGAWGERWPVNVAEGAPMNPRLFVENVGQKGWKIADFVDTPMPKLTNSQLDAQFSLVVSKINDAQLKVDTYPSKLAELNTAHAVTRSLVDACGHLKTIA